MNFKKVYRLPLTNSCGIVFCSNFNTRAFDFKFIGEDAQKSIIDCLNGDGKKIRDNVKITHENGELYYEKEKVKKNFITIRGWGYLTGTGGLNLKLEEASKIQDDFAEWIIETLIK